MSKKYLLGVDGGTEGLRAGIFDVFGTPLAFASTSYPTQFPAPSWAEQDPNDWWYALGKSVRKAHKVMVSTWTHLLYSQDVPSTMPFSQRLSKRIMKWFLVPRY